MVAGLLGLRRSTRTFLGRLRRSRWSCCCIRHLRYDELLIEQRTQNARKQRAKSLTNNTLHVQIKRMTRKLRPALIKRNARTSLRRPGQFHRATMNGDRSLLALCFSYLVSPQSVHPMCHKAHPKLLVTTGEDFFYQILELSPFV